MVPALDRVITSAMQQRRRARARTRDKAPIPLRHHYLVTTEKGVFRVGPEGVRQLTRLPGYGLAISGETVYLSYEMTEARTLQVRRASYVCRLPLAALLDGTLRKTTPGRVGDILYKQPFQSTNGRIHQLSLGQDKAAAGAERLVISATNENAVVVMDPATGTNTKRYPVADAFGQPVTGYDANHINSAVMVDGTIYFVCYRGYAGHSFLGYIDADGATRGWDVSPAGFHDLLPVPGGFLTCDTFGRAEHGKVLAADGDWRAEAFRTHGWAPRGVAWGEDETVVGHSHKGPRRLRFAGNGGLIAVTDGTLAYHEMPWAQTYSIHRETPESPDGITHDGLREALTQRFGPERVVCPAAAAESFSVVRRLRG